MKAASMVASLMLLLPHFALAQAGPAVAGSIKRLAGDVVIERGAGRLPAREGMHIFAHDVLETGAGASLGIILQDGTRVAMGANSRLEIDSFLYDPAAGRLGMLLRLLRGVMVYVSGKMAELAPGSVRVETPVAVVGLRGTELAISLEGH